MSQSGLLFNLFSSTRPVNVSSFIDFTDARVRNELFAVIPRALCRFLFERTVLSVPRAPFLPPLCVTFSRCVSVWWVFEAPLVA